MKVTLKEITSIKPYEENPRIITDGAIKAVAASIEQFGFQQPIVVDKNGVIIVGHTRLLAAQSLNLKKVPVVVADTLTDEQVAAYRLADNKTGELSGWNLAKLEKELENIVDIDMSEFGFEELEDELEDEEPEKPTAYTLTLKFTLSEGDEIDDYLDEYDKEDLTRLIMEHIREVLG